MTNKILAIRFSAFGDVIIAHHVICALLEQNPDLEILFLTKPFFAQLFKDIPRLETIHFSKDFDGLLGLWRLKKYLKKNWNFSIIIDIHNSLRSNILKFYFLFGKKIFSFSKGKKEKRQLTRKKNKLLKPLKHTAERYCEAFRKAGFNCNLANYKPSRNYSIFLPKDLPFNNQAKIVGIAPFAKHKQKTYPIELTEQVIKKLSQNFYVLIFGGGEKELKIAQKWEKQFQNVFSVIGKYNIFEEIALIDRTFAFITMDSANMHLASLTKTNIISIWGATHPYLGFYPLYGYQEKLTIGIDLPCRPCSVFGNKKCHRGDLACLYRISPDLIVNKVKQLL